MNSCHACWGQGYTCNFDYMQGESYRSALISVSACFTCTSHPKLKSLGPVTFTKYQVQAKGLDRLK